MSSKKLTKKKPKIVWAAMVNLSGLYSKNPVKCKYVPDVYETEKGNDRWWSLDGDFDVRKLGEHKTDGHIAFVSENKQDVEKWLKGAKSVMSLLRNWASCG